MDKSSESNRSRTLYVGGRLFVQRSSVGLGGARRSSARLGSARRCVVGAAGRSPWSRSFISALVGVLSCLSLVLRAFTLIRARARVLNFERDNGVPECVLTVF